MNEWVIVGIAVVATVVLMGGGGVILRTLTGRKKTETPQGNA